MNIRLTDEATDDLRGAIDWYASSGAARKKGFRASIDEAFKRIGENPLAFAQVHANIRRFPYAVFYVPEPNEIVVLAVMHMRRNPSEWKGRTGD